MVYLNKFGYIDQSILVLLYQRIVIAVQSVGNQIVHVVVDFGIHLQHAQSDSCLLR